MAVGIGAPNYGASFLPHLSTVANKAFMGGFRPTESARGSKPITQSHVSGQMTGNDYLDYCQFLGGKKKLAVWIGTLEDARRQRIARAVCLRLRKFGTAVGFIPANWSGVDLPDRVAIWGLTPCGRVELHRRINDGRNREIVDSVEAWSELVRQIWGGATIIDSVQPGAADSAR